MIFLIISDKKGRILYLGNLHLGSAVDMGIFKKELAHFNYQDLCVWLDLGFIGVRDMLEDGTLQLGYKRGKNKQLTDAEKVINYEINRVRIKVEHAIGSMKRYYILRHENRMKKPHINQRLDTCVELCAALSNFRKAA